MQNETFKENDTIEMLQDCSGAKKGNRYRLVYSHQPSVIVAWFGVGNENAEGIAGCPCPEHWKKIQTPDDGEIKVGDVFEDVKGNKRKILGACYKVSKRNNLEEGDYSAWSKEDLKLYTYKKLKQEQLTKSEAQTELSKARGVDVIIKG